MENQNKHIPVLLSEVLKYLDPSEGDKYLDLTAGYGGHASNILERTLQPSATTLVDRDQTAIDYLGTQKQFAKSELIHTDFLRASEQLLSRGSQFDIILADLGLSSPHLDSADRGFSIKDDGPLDMRMDSRLGLTAKSIVNNYDEAEIAKLLREYGEEPKARTIARLIVEHRPINTTRELAQLIARAWKGSASRHHPAIRSFQALRIAVNDELGLLKASLPKWIQLLAPGGRIVIISFHSLEDRIVKEYLRENSGDRYDAPLRLLAKKPVTAGEKELVNNPRARSAKLRAVVKIKTNRKEK